MVFAIIILIFFAIFYAFLNTNLFPNGKHFYSKYPAYVTVEVEESLNEEAVAAMMKIAFRSMNETFGYDINLANLTTFEDDGLDTYEMDWVIENYFEGEFLRKAIFDLRWKAITGGRIDMSIRIYDGELPSFDGPVPTEVVGISNRGAKIALFFEESKGLSDIVSTNTIKTVLHEFGHAFGLGHNSDSPIMFTAQDAENVYEATAPPLAEPKIFIDREYTWIYDPSVLISRNFNDSAEILLNETEGSETVMVFYQGSQISFSYGHKYQNQDNPNVHIYIIIYDFSDISNAWLESEIDFGT